MKFLYNSLMLKKKSFVAPTGVHDIHHERPERHLKLCLLFFGRIRFYITFENTLNTAHLFFSVPSHSTKRDKMGMHTRVLLLISGTFLFTVFVLNECVSTYFYLSLCLANANYYELHCSMKRKKNS